MIRYVVQLIAVETSPEGIAVRSRIEALNRDHAKALKRALERSIDHKYDHRCEIMIAVHTSQKVIYIEEPRFRDFVESLNTALAAAEFSNPESLKAV